MAGADGSGGQCEPERTTLTRTRSKKPAPEILWQPSASQVNQCNLTAFSSSVEVQTGLDLACYDDLWTWSVDHPGQFWQMVGQFFGVPGFQSPEIAARAVPAFAPDGVMSGRGWFPGTNVNYAQQILMDRDPNGIALICCAEDEPDAEVSWGELTSQVAALASHLREWGVEPGDRVVGYLPNIREAVVALLATASLGAIWSCCAPEYGVQAVLDRFKQIQPKVLIAADGYRYAGKRISRTSEIAEIVNNLKSLQAVVLVANLPISQMLSFDIRTVSWRDVQAVNSEIFFRQVPFDHPLWILYSSGTTGIPKGITHSHGGIMLAHLNWLGLHNDVRPGDRFFWYTTTAWMVWNAVVSSLLLGATAVLYDGSPGYPLPYGAWSLTARVGAKYFGTSASYITRSMQDEMHPGKDLDLSELRSILSTGSPLPVDAWRWIYGEVSADIWLDAPCGGTDVCAPYFGASPTKPVVAGEIQARLLGTPVYARNDSGEFVEDEVGELVVTGSMPSMPLGFWADDDGSLYKKAYFETFPGLWRHGDWITISSRGTATVHGRSDSTINRHGVRMGTSEIHAAVERVPRVRESLVIGAELEDGRYRMPLFVVLKDGDELDDELQQEISNQIIMECSRRHVPDEMIQVRGIPHTITGKKLEVPVKRLLQGVPMQKAVNLGVVDDPSLLDFFVSLGAEWRG